MARGARAVELHVGGRWFDSACAARFFFRYETGALSHQFEAESTVRFSILLSWRVLIESCLVSTTLPGKVLEAGMRSRSRRSRHILVGAGAGAGAAETVCADPEPEP